MGADSKIYRAVQAVQRIEFQIEDLESELESRITELSAAQSELYRLLPDVGDGIKFVISYSRRGAGLETIQEITHPSRV